MPPQSLLRALQAALMALLVACPAAQALTLRTVAVCDDANEWPPFTFLAPGSPAPSSGRAPQNVLGFSVEVLRAILAPKGIEMRIELLPWVRCLRELETGTQFQMALNATFNPERQRRFWLTEPVHATTPGYVYSRRRFPQGVPVRSAQDLAGFRVCGVHGYNYSHYSLRDDQIDRGALNFGRVIAKLLADRCELGVGELEVVKAVQFDGRSLATHPDIAYARVPGMAQVEYHMLVSRQHPEGQALLQLLNQGLKELRDSGRLQALHKRYTY